MKETQFIQRHESDWQQLERLLGDSDRSSQHWLEFPVLYQQCCHHLAQAKQRNYSPYLLERLNQIVGKGHRELYQHQHIRTQYWWRFIARDFPIAVRNNQHFVIAAGLLFFIPLLLMAWLTYLDNELIYSLMPAASVAEYESMYSDPDVLANDERSDLGMFAFYIYNNISIGFQCFASGMILGIGSVFYTVFNGVMIGSVMGYAAQSSFSENFFGFVAGHGSFELLAIVLCSAAGLKLGFAIMAPAPYSRRTSIRIRAKEALTIVYGATIMLFIAALIEGFWSAEPIGSTIKYWVGGIGWALNIAYFCLAGRLSDKTISHET